MKITITLKERVPDIIYSSIKVDIKKRFESEQIFQKYFRSNAPPLKPVIRFSYNETSDHFFILKPVIFKSGRKGFSGMSFWDNFIIRANISHNEYDEPSFYLLTVVLDNNNNNNEGDNSHEL